MIITNIWVLARNGDSQNFQREIENLQALERARGYRTGEVDASFDAGRILGHYGVS